MALGRVRRYIEELLNPNSPYYSRGVLNSEGMTVLSVVARELLKEMPWLKGRLEKARSRRDFETVSRVLRSILEEYTTEQP